MLSKQLHPGFRRSNGPGIIHNTHLDNNAPFKSLALPENSGTAVGAEVASNRVSTIGRLRKFFRCSLDSEPLVLDDNIGAVSRA